MFEIRNHDGLGRRGLLTINKKTIQTPNIAVVVNPNDLIIKPKEMMSEFGVNIIITNAYIIKNSEKAGEIEQQGLHEFYDFPGIIYTDSGTYQMYSKGGVQITNKETLDYQKRIGSDIHTPLDLFTLPTDNRKTALFKLKETIKRVKSVESEHFTAPIQGGLFTDLRARACKKLAQVPATIYPIGGIVPLMSDYDFKRLVRIILECKKNLPLNTPVHAFGAGHPLIFSLLAYAGIDLFDSASYALYARQGKYLTETGTKDVNDLVSLPCDCPVCNKHTPEELTIKLLARHNLHMIMREVRLVKQAIHEGRLFELVSARARSHPNIYYAFKELLKEKELINQHDPVRKRNALFWTGPLSDERPEIFYAKQKLKSLGFRKVPRALKLVYPFGQSLGWSIDYSKKKYSDLATLQLLADYQFGKGAGALIKDVDISYSRNHRIHQVFRDDELLFVVRSGDGYFSLQSAGAELFKNFLKKVKVSSEFIKFYEEGGDVFAKHVLKASDIKPHEEVGVFTGRKLIAVGEAMLSGEEMMEFDRGVAVKVRQGL